VTTEINIYLHGFFFTEIQGSNLVIASPKHDMHKFGYWDHQQNLFLPFPATSDSFPWINFLKQGQQDYFRSGILQFSRKEIGVPDNMFFIGLPADHYKVYITLPLPKDITSVRAGGNIKEISMDRSGKVAQSIYTHCGEDTDLGLITCLTYVSTANIGFTDISFYAEHCHAPDISGIKYLFQDAQLVFPSFDLKFTAFNPGKPLPAEQNDENLMTLCEAGARLKNNPCKPSMPVGEDRATKNPMIGTLLRTANCPQFGIGG
jgi:hypothetical protein